MKALVLLMAVLTAGCAQVSLTVYSDSMGTGYTTIKTSEGTRIVVTRHTMEVEEVK